MQLYAVLCGALGSLYVLGLHRIALLIPFLRPLP